jgi:hypothetical protein
MSGTSSVLARQPGIVFPSHLRRTLRYVDRVELTSTSGGHAYYQFRANSLFDPDLSGTGHQPRYFDQLCSATGPYTTYRVHGCSVRLCVVPSDSAIWNVAAGFTDSSTLSAGISGAGLDLAYAELPGWIGWLMPLASGPSHTMTFKALMGQIHNVPESAIKIDDQYAAAYNANPVDTAYFNIVGNTAASTDTLTVGVFIDFDVTFEDPYTVASS